MMRALRLGPFLVFGLWLLGAGIAPAAEAEFVAGIDDLPLMEGLQQTPEGAVVFDKPSGRIVIAEATGTPADAAIMAFYRKTLPQLGWTGGKNGIFKRAGEQLAIEFDGKGAGRLVRFTLSPAHKR